VAAPFGFLELCHDRARGAKGGPADVRIAEIYRSRQGEGLFTGMESVFVRASGCNLRCWYCDTPYASWQPEGEDRAVDEIAAEVAAYGCVHVVITGGEPMLFAELVPLCDDLRRRGLHITIETAGTLYLSLPCDLMSISPKLSNSTPSPEEAGRWSERHERARHAPAVMERLLAEYEYQLKFVIDTPADVDEVASYLAGFPQVAANRVWLMPQGTTAAQLAAVGQWLEPLCRQRGWRFCPRRQIEWYGAQRGT
jgi:7-carboxy-7-deazaguanine synthase